MMNFSLASANPLTQDAELGDVLILLAADGLDLGEPLQAGLSLLVKRALAAGHWSTDSGKRLSLYLPESRPAARVELLGIGDGSLARIRDALAKLVKELAVDPLKLAVCFAQDATDAQWTAAMTAIAAGGHVYGTTKPSARGGLKKVLLGAPNAAARKSSLAYGKALVAGMTLAREWANRPGNHATPGMLGEVARHIAAQARKDGGHGQLECEVLEQKQIEKLGMGSFLSVAKGSDEAPRFIVLRYEGADDSQRPLVFVGKGITFDSGGISLKPGAGMDEMKFDMGGAASVLGLFESLRLLRPKINVVGLIPTCENMPSGRALKPGDVVQRMSGQTIEILNTDAEGRLILCDALTYAERFQPQAVVDIATLTGNCVLALGHLRSGLFSTNDVLAHELQRAADESSDLCWRMPMDDVYGKDLKSNFADMANVAGRLAGAISAAKFLERFTGRYPWAHLDIAGTAWDEGAAKGATGRPVPLLLQFALNMAEQPVDFGPSVAQQQSQAGKVAAPSRTAKTGKVAKAAPRSKSGKRAG